MRSLDLPTFECIYIYIFLCTYICKSINIYVRLQSPAILCIVMLIQIRFPNNEAARDRLSRSRLVIFRNSVNITLLALAAASVGNVYVHLLLKHDSISIRISDSSLTRNHMDLESIFASPWTLFRLFPRDPVSEYCAGQSPTTYSPLTGRTPKHIPSLHKLLSARAAQFPADFLKVIFSPSSKPRRRILFPSNIDMQLSRLCEFLGC